VPSWVWTWIFQIANFVILVFLLKRFLYGPILRAIDRRDGKIASHFEAAEEKEKEAAEKAEALERETREFREQRDGLLRDAQAEADKRRRELTHEAREDVEDLSRLWREELKREKDAFLALMQARATEQVCAVARRALEDLADAELDRRMAVVLVGKLAELPDDTRTAFAEAVKAADGRVVVASAYEVQEGERKKIAAAVRQHLAPDAEVAFETAPELACGVELRAGGHEISWTIATYVLELQEELARLIDEKLEAERQRLEAEAAREKAAREKAEREKAEAEEQAAEEKQAAEEEPTEEKDKAEEPLANDEKKAGKPQEEDQPE